MSQMNEITLEIDNIDNDKPHNDNPAVTNIDKPHNDNPVTKIGKPHSGKPITKIEVSINESYLVTYSHEDRSIVGWTIKDIDEGPLKLEKTVKLDDIGEEANFELRSMCVSDNKELVYISKNGALKIYDMNNDQKIKLNWSNCKSRDYCTFNLYDELILYNDEHKKFSIYSTQTKNNEWSFLDTFRISTYFEDFRLISISYQNECYLFSNKSIYKWNSNTKKSTKILVINENIGENIRENIRIIGNEKFICTRIEDIIIIYSVELKILVASLNLNNDIQLSMFDKYPTLFPLFINITSNGFSDSIMKYYWKKCLCHYDLLPIESYPSIIRATSKHVFGFIDGNVWKIDLEKMKTNEEYDNDVKINEEMSKMYDHLHILLLDSYVDTVRELFQKAITNYNSKDELKESQNSIEWKITCKDYKIELQVFKNNVSICTRGVEFVELTVVSSLLGFKLINDDIIILTNVKNNKSSLLKYGVELLKFAINEHKLELIEEIYKECINYFEEDFNNIIFLSIINSNLPLLDKYYPEYILRYSLETEFIVDSPSYDRVNDYNRFSDFFWPQSSPFIETINSDIYKTWSGEALLNFKWNTYGKAYHSLFWSGYLILLVCFNVAVRISQQEYVDIQKILFIISIIFGFFYLCFGVRQFIYDPYKWIFDIGKIYGYFNISKIS
ncbi:hypothetical protein RhiirA4_460806 [Rhizophagus irregularis]|uniref:Ion transport domain-containing protein n=1 Tax=Rhizophagus irregularis TaxID=588596 RepID=A0A2I1GHF5_9GLOM|nr:hypothetical protein RhiirA4_460806 [Rhizophagus irregularis]